MSIVKVFKNANAATITIVRTAPKNAPDQSHRETVETIVKSRADYDSNREDSRAENLLKGSTVEAARRKGAALARKDLKMLYGSASESTDSLVLRLLGFSTADEVPSEPADLTTADEVPADLTTADEVPADLTTADEVPSEPADLTTADEVPSEP